MAREIGLTGSGSGDGGGFAGVYAAGAGGEIAVPHGALILTGDYQRAGPDLVIEGTGGERVLLTDYFTQAEAPDLVTAGGARVAGDLAERLAGAMAPGQVAQAGSGQQAAPIGEVANIAGTVTATRGDGTSVQLAQGSPVYQGDVIETGQGAAVGIKFIDETVFSMDDAGRMVLDEMVYDPASQSGSAAFSLVQGVFSFATGHIAKTDPASLVVRTPVAMIGVRGTDVLVDLSQVGEQSQIACREGAIVVSNDGGEQLVLAGQLVALISFSSAPSEPTAVPLSVLEQEFGRALQFRPEQQLDGTGQRGENDEGGEDGPSPEQLGELAPAAGGENQEIGEFDVTGDLVLAGVDLGTQPQFGTGTGTFGSTGIGGYGSDSFTDTFLGNLPPEVEIISGGAGDDVLFGTDGPDIMFGGAGDDILMSSRGNDTLVGGDGIDTADYSGDESPIVANLGAGTASGAFTGDDVLDGIENLVGSAFGDHITGGDDDNTIDAGAGADTLVGGSGAGNDLYIGGAGRDQVVYTSATAGIIVNLATGITNGEAGGVGTDTLIGIEDVVASNFGDIVIGDGNANHLQGAGGDDVLIGLAGDDTLDGGAGTDLANYGGATGTVIVNLSTGQASGGDGNDVLIGIENVQGSEFADWLTGDGNANDLSGGGGDDLLVGNAGNDVLIGGAGNDTLIGGFGSDSLSGGDGDDVLIGGADNDLLFGNGGNDVLYVGAGADAIFGGDGNDRFIMGDPPLSLPQSPAQFSGGLVAFDLTITPIHVLDDQISGGAGNDTLQANGDLVISSFDSSFSIETIESDSRILGNDSDNLLDFSSITVTPIGNVPTYVFGSPLPPELQPWQATIFNIPIQGQGGDDTILGTAANDGLYGQDGNDMLVGNAGADYISGGAGNDVLYGDSVITSPTLIKASVGTLETFDADEFQSLWGDVLLTGATTTTDGLGPFQQSNVDFTDSGIGVFGVEHQDADPEEIAYDATNEVSEVLRVDFGREVFDVLVRVDFLFGSETVKGRTFTEQGEWVALKNGVEIGTGLFSGADGNEFNVIIDAGQSFDTLLFSATAYVKADGTLYDPYMDPPANRIFNDSSDYYVRQITYSYDGTFYADSGSGNDILTGGAGADILRGGGGGDLFHYEAPGDGTAIANDGLTVGQSGLAVDQVLDFSSLVDGDKFSFDGSAFLFDGGPFDPDKHFVSLNQHYDGTNSGTASGAVFVFDGKYLSYDADVQQEGYTAIAEVQGDAPKAADVVVS
jgi:Ca2+-binding RTX toxin-like protein